MTKAISLENLQEFKNKCDQTYAPIGGGGGGGVTFKEYDLLNGESSKTFTGGTPNAVTLPVTPELDKVYFILIENYISSNLAASWGGGFAFDSGTHPTVLYKSGSNTEFSMCLFAIAAGTNLVVYTQGSDMVVTSLKLYTIE